MTTVIAAAGIAGSVGAATAGAQEFDLQGHRGARGLMPENTLPGFAKALSIGVSTLELDVGVARDGHVVVIHNPHMEPEITRTPDGNWLDDTGPAINAMTLEEIKSFDVGRLNPATRYARKYPDQQAVDGARVPTLAEVFALVARSGNETLKFNIETKLDPEKPELGPSPADFARAVLDVVHAHKLEDRVIIQSFDWRTLREVQRLAPEITTAYLTVNQSWFNTLQPGQPGPSPWLAGFDIDNHDGSIPHAVKAAGGDIWSSYHGEVDAGSIKTAHDLGLRVNAWTVNDSDRMEQLIDMNIDGIITDYPNRLRDVMKRRNMPLPLPTPVTP